MNTKQGQQRENIADNSESPKKATDKISTKAHIMYETERKNAAKLIGIERRQYLFVFILILVGLATGLAVFDVSYTLAAVIGGCGALVLVVTLLAGTASKTESAPESKSDGKKEA